MRGVTIKPLSEQVTIAISTHTPHARRDRGKKFPVSDISISTHTPHARRDWNALSTAQKLENFNSHASCEA